MQRLEVSCAVARIYTSLCAKGLSYYYYVCHYWKKFAFISKNLLILSSCIYTL